MTKVRAATREAIVDACRSVPPGDRVAVAARLILGLSRIPDGIARPADPRTPTHHSQGATHDTQNRSPPIRPSDRTIALSATVPSFLHKTGVALAGPSHPDAKPPPGLKDNHVLVILQLAGGNDGLNTLVPYADDQYHKLRPRIGISAEEGAQARHSLRPASRIPRVHKLFHEGGLALVPNVGYPDPCGSHFRSSDIWETASPSGRTWKSGWIGRYFDAECQGVPARCSACVSGDNPR